MSTIGTVLHGAEFATDTGLFEFVLAGEAVGLEAFDLVAGGVVLHL